MFRIPQKTLLQSQHFIVGNQPTFGQDPVPYPRPSVQFHPLTENRVIPINFSPADTYAEEGPQRRVTDKKKYKQ